MRWSLLPVAQVPSTCFSRRLETRLSTSEFLANPERVVVNYRRGGGFHSGPSVGATQRYTGVRRPSTSLGIEARNSSRIVVGSGEENWLIVRLASRQIQRIEGPTHEAGITGIIDLDGQHSLPVAWDNKPQNLVVRPPDAEFCIPPRPHIAGNVRTGINGVAFDAARRLLYTVGADGTIVLGDVASPSRCRLLASNPAKQDASSFDRLL